MSKRVIGLEIANSSIKAVTLNEKKNHIESFYCPNTIREVMYSDIDLELANQKVTYYTIGKKKYEIGIPDATGTGGKERDYSSDEFVAQVIITISKLLEFETEEVYLVYGLPATSYDNTSITNQIMKLKGKHEVYENRKKRFFEIKDVKILAQPVGTLFSMAFDVNGNLTNQLDPRKKYLIIDIGWGTTDLVAVSLRSGIGEKDTMNYAMSDYNRQLRDVLDKKYQNRHIRDLYKHLYDFDRDIREGSLLVRSGEITTKEISKEIDFIQLEFAQKIKDRLSINGWDFGSYHNIIITGGGGLQVFNAIKKVFPKEYASDFLLVDDPIMCNSTGFYIFGRKHFKM